MRLDQVCRAQPTTRIHRGRHRKQASSRDLS